MLVFITACASAVLLMAGTFAWRQAVSQINEFVGERDGDITLHDDFNPKTGVKDVYVESDSTNPIFIRVKLNETMNLSSNNRVPGPGGWITHTYGESAADCGHVNGAGQYFHDCFMWTMGGWKYYMPAASGQQLAQDTTVYNGTEPGVKMTPDARVVSIADYLLNNDEWRAAFIGWIYDTDGFAYWSQPLYQHDVTGLLLHKVTTSDSIKGSDYYYAIDVIAQAVDINDIPMWTQGAAASDGSGAHYETATASGMDVIKGIVAMAYPETGENGLSEGLDTQSQPGGQDAADTENATDGVENTDASDQITDGSEALPADEVTQDETEPAGGETETAPQEEAPQEVGTQEENAQVETSQDDAAQEAGGVPGDSVQAVDDGGAV